MPELNSHGARQCQGRASAVDAHHHASPNHSPEPSKLWLPGHNTMHDEPQSRHVGPVIFWLRRRAPQDVAASSTNDLAKLSPGGPQCAGLFAYSRSGPCPLAASRRPGRSKKTRNASL